MYINENKSVKLRNYLGDYLEFFLGVMTSLKNSSELKWGHFDLKTSLDPAPFFLLDFSFANSLE